MITYNKRKNDLQNKFHSVFAISLLSKYKNFIEKFTLYYKRLTI